MSKIKKDWYGIKFYIPPSWVEPIRKICEKRGKVTLSELMRSLLEKELKKEGYLGGKEG